MLGADNDVILNIVISSEHVTSYQLATKCSEQLTSDIISIISSEHLRSYQLVTKCSEHLAISSSSSSAQST